MSLDSKKVGWDRVKQPHLHVSQHDPKGIPQRKAAEYLPLPTYTHKQMSVNRYWFRPVGSTDAQGWGLPQVHSRFIPPHTGVTEKRNLQWKRYYVGDPTSDTSMRSIFPLTVNAPTTSGLCRVPCPNQLTSSTHNPTNSEQKVHVVHIGQL